MDGNHQAIDGNQYAFVKNRNIMDCILIANESVEDYIRTKKRGTLIKLDLRKAYDLTDWEFLDYVLARKGFGAKWRLWIRGCLTTSCFSILINGSAKGFFSASRGLRQGDPLSPFLFTLVADALTQILSTGEHQNLFRGFRIGKEQTRISY